MPGDSGLRVDWPPYLVHYNQYIKAKRGLDPHKQTTSYHYVRG